MTLWLRLKHHLIENFRKTRKFCFFQAKDQNLDYGQDYEGEEMSKTIDVNPEYDYDYLQT